MSKESRRKKRRRKLRKRKEQDNTGSGFCKHDWMTQGSIYRFEKDAYVITETCRKCWGDRFRNVTLEELEERPRPVTPV